MAKIKLGTTARDTLSGFEGVLVARTEWLYGCVRVGLAGGVDKEGVPRDPFWFDEAQVEVVPKKKVEPVRAATGGPSREGGRVVEG